MPKLTLKRASWALRLSGLLIFPAIFLFNRSLLGDAFDVIGQARPAYLVAATALMLAASFVRAMRWRVVAEAAGVHYPHFVDYLSIYYAGLFLGAVVPQMAASFAPVILMTEDGHSWKRSSISILFDRLLETLVILLFACAAAAYLFPSYHKVSAVVFLISGGMLAGGAMLIWMTRVAPRFVARFEVGPLARLRKVTDAIESPEAKSLYAGMRASAWQLALLSSVVMVLQVSVVVLLGEALSLHASVGFLAASAAMVVLVVMLPISVAGLGSREGILVLLFTAAGEPKEAAIALGVLLFFVGLVARLPGVTGWLRRGAATQPERNDSVAAAKPVTAD
jgi:uncharacterized protein (TIRG00374 family)